MGGADQVEGAALAGGRGGELVDGLAADADGVAGEGGEVVDQVAEATDGLFAGAPLAGGLGGGRRGTAGGVTGLPRAGGCSSV